MWSAVTSEVMALDQARLSFLALYLVTKMQFVKEQNKFVAKFGSLSTEQANSAKSQRNETPALSARGLLLSPFRAVCSSK